MNSEQALLVSHLSSFIVIEADESIVGTQFQALLINNIRKNEDSITSSKYAPQVVQKGPSNVWGRVIDPPVNKNRTGLGFSLKNEVMKLKSSLSKSQDIFHSARYLHPTTLEANAILEDEPEIEMPNFVTHGVRVHNWITVDVPTCICISK